MLRRDIPLSILKLAAWLRANPTRCRADFTEGFLDYAATVACRVLEGAIDRPSEALTAAARSSPAAAFPEAEPFLRVPKKILRDLDLAMLQTTEALVFDKWPKNKKYLVRRLESAHARMGEF